VGTTNDGDDAWEGLLGDVKKLNTESVRGPRPTEILILALEDGTKLDFEDPTYQFRARILGGDGTKPMPCFDFVKDIWGTASRKAADAYRNDSNVLAEYPEDDLNAAARAALRVAAHTQFTTAKDSPPPRLGDIWAATVEYTSEKSSTIREGTATATTLEYPAGENSPIMNERIWEPAIAEFFSKVKEHKETRKKKPGDTGYSWYRRSYNKTTGTLSEGCESLMKLFEEELSTQNLSGLTALPDPPNCHTHPEDPKCSWWMKQNTRSDNWYLTPGKGEWPDLKRADGEKRWNYGLTPPLNAEGKLREMWTVFREELEDYVNKYIENYVSQFAAWLPELTLDDALQGKFPESKPANPSIPGGSAVDLITYAGDFSPELVPDIGGAQHLSVENNGVHRVLWASITPGSASRTAGSKHGAGLANDMFLHANILPNGKYKGIPSNKILAKNQLLTDAFISFTADWNSRRGDEHQVLWGGTFSGGASALGIPARSRGITEFHHWELTNAAIAIAFKGLGTQLEAIGAPTPEDFANAGTIEHVLLKLYKKLNDGNNLAGADDFGEILKEGAPTHWSTPAPVVVAELTDEYDDDDALE